MTKLKFELKYHCQMALTATAVFLESTDAMVVHADCPDVRELHVDHIVMPHKLHP